MNRARLVGVIHLPPLAGSPRASAVLRAAETRAAEDAKILADAGFDLVMIENFGDAPFFAGKVPAVTVAMMTACAWAARTAAPSLPLGINVLRNDGDAALAIAHAVGAACIRVNVLTGARVTDQGLIQGDAASLFRTRRALGADGIEVWADIDVKHSAPLAARPLTDEVADLVSRALAGAVLVTGEGTGRSVDTAKLEEVHRAVQVSARLRSSSRAGRRSERSRLWPAAARGSSSAARSAPTASPAARSMRSGRPSSREHSAPPSQSRETRAQ